MKAGWRNRREGKVFAIGHRAKAARSEKGEKPTIKSRRARGNGLLAALVPLHFEPARGIYLKDRIVFRGSFPRRTYRFLALCASLSFVDILSPRVASARKMLDSVARFLYFFLFFPTSCHANLPGVSSSSPSSRRLAKSGSWQGTRDEYKIPRRSCARPRVRDARRSNTLDRQIWNF